LQFDLFLVLDDADLDFLGLDQLAGFEFLQIIGEVGLGLLHVHGGLVLGDVGLVIALGLGDFGVGGELGLLAGLLGLGGADLGIPVGFGLGDDGVALDLGDAGFAQGIQIALPVADVADGEADDGEAHVGHVAGGHFLDFGGEGVAVLVDFLDGHGAENGAQMALEGLHGDVLDVIHGLAQKLFRRRGDGNIIALDLDLGHAVHAHGHALAGVNLGRLDVNGEQFEGEDVHLFQDGQYEAPAAFDDAEADFAPGAVRLDNGAFSAGNHQHLIGSAFGVAAGVNDG